MEQNTKEERRKKVVEVLNKARSMELHAIGQYMNQHYNLDDLDFGDMAAKVKLIAIDEMRHAEMFAERIKELGGEPTAEPTAKAQRGQEVKSMFSFDANLEDIPSTRTINNDAGICFAANNVQPCRSIRGFNSSLSQSAKG